MTLRHDIVLVGGGVASARCARTLRRNGFTGSILLLTDESRLPYNRPPLSKELLRGEVPEELILAEPERWYERRGVAVRSGSSGRVTAVDPESRSVTLADNSSVAYGELLLATGAEPIRPPIPGVADALTLRTVDDATALRERAVAGAAVAIVGGGFIGVEVAASLAARGCQVTLLEREAALWAGSLGRHLGEWAAGALRSAGIDLRLGVTVTSVDASGVTLADGSSVAGSPVVVGVGVRPRQALALDAGLDCRDGVAVDATQRASQPHAWAAGDVARVDGRRVEHWHAAREGGERAALSMLGLPVLAPPPPWVFSEFASHSLDVVGWAPAWDEERLLPGATADRFGVAFIDRGRVAAVASVNGFLPVETLRPFLAELPREARLAELMLGA